MSFGAWNVTPGVHKVGRMNYHITRRVDGKRRYILEPDTIYCLALMSTFGGDIALNGNIPTRFESLSIALLD